MFKKLIFNPWLILIAGVFAFAVGEWLEHRRFTDHEKVTQQAYTDAQQVISDKVVQFVKFTGNQLLDTNKLQRNWSTIIDATTDQNIIIHIYKNDTLLFWSSNEVITKTCLDDFKTGSGFWQHVNGNYLTFKKTSGSFTYLFLYQINSNFAFKNEYIFNRFNNELSFIKEGFILSKPIERFVDIKDITGNYLFSLQIFSIAYHFHFVIIILLSLAILLTLLSIHLIARHHIRNRPIVTTILFFVMMILIRWLNMHYHIPAFLYENKLFDPAVYASSNIFPSLGDLFIDAWIILWYLIILENRMSINPITDGKTKQPNILWPVIMITVSFLLCLMVSHTVFNFVKSLTIDSQISFNIGKVSSINLFTYVGILVCVFMMLTVYFVSRNFTRITRRFEQVSNQTKRIILGIVSISWLVMIPYYTGAETYHTYIAFGLVIAFVSFKIFIRKFNRFQQYFVVICVISLFTALSITHWVTIKEHDNRKLFAERFVTQNDITTEYFLRTIERKIADDRNIPDYFQYFFTKSKFEKRIKQLYFTGYLSKFEVSVFDYDTAGYDLKQKNAYSYNQINKIYLKQSLETIDNYFRYISGTTSLKGYLAKFPVKKSNGRVGYLFILLQPKLIQDENRFDELLIEGFKQNKNKLFDYSYAVYKNKHLIFQRGEYPYRITNTWGEARDTFRFFTENDFEHVLYTDNQPLTIAVSKRADTNARGIALFSFIFTFCTLILIFILFIYTGLNSSIPGRSRFFNNRIFRFLRHFVNKLMLVDDTGILYISTRIQTFIIFIVFITLASTSYFTISFISQKYDARQTERLMKKLRDVVITIENENVTEMDDPSGDELVAFINQLADLYDTDITLYDLNGKVRASSISKIYDEGIVSDLVNPEAYYHLSLLKESQYTQTERIASLGFQAAYAPVFNKKSELLGYILLPYFSQKVDLLNEISSVMVGFINLYVLLFIVIGIMAFLVSRNISYPLMLIRQKLSSTVLGTKNEPIIWKRDDEIGELVKQYNSMIEQLEESARKLAETEREGTWREIARQIAHEIKNPLTPMKLSIQHLQRAFKNNDINIGDKLNRTAQLLITQIDTLSDLATEFSSYAKMPEAIYENFNVCRELYNITELYSNHPDMVITMSCPEHIEINFDRSYFNRSIGNIVKNAIQSITEGKQGEIHIDVKEHNETVYIIVKDNGSGMTPEQADKIFVPYFSTKVSGMGLGLPLVKNMIESCGGQITFNTSLQEGTEFTITLPKNST